MSLLMAETKSRLNEILAATSSHSGEKEGCNILRRQLYHREWRRPGAGSRPEMGVLFRELRRSL